MPQHPDRNGQPESPRCSQTADFGEFEVSAPIIANPECDEIFAGAEELEADSRYLLQDEIARGGMGVVVRAYDRLLQRDVAIKLLLRKFLDRPLHRQRFVEEALMTSRLQHPCVVPIYDRGMIEEDRPYFAMKLVSGETLDSMLAREAENHLERSRMLKVFEQVCQTMAYAHSLGILHLDLKPGNVMVGHYGEVHLMDWGLARSCGTTVLPDVVTETRPSYPVSSSSGSEGPNRICGTPAYMSPEQAKGDSVDVRTDVFGLGGILCEILTGRPPYRGEDNRRIHSRAFHCKLDDAFQGLDHCDRDAELASLAKSCLEPDPRKRPAGANQVAGEVSRYLGNALEQAESDLSRFFDLSLDMFCIATLDGYFDRVNVNFTRVLGYSVQQLVSQPFLDFVHPDDVQQTKDVMSDLLVGKPVVQFCNRYLHSRGYYVTLEWTARSLPDEGRIFAVARNVIYRDKFHSQPL